MTVSTVKWSAKVSQTVAATSSEVNARHVGIVPDAVCDQLRVEAATVVEAQVVPWTLLVADDDRVDPRESALLPVLLLLSSLPSYIVLRQHTPYNSAAIPQNTPKVATGHRVGQKSQSFPDFSRALLIPALLTHSKKNVSAELELETVN